MTRGAARRRCSAPGEPKKRGNGERDPLCQQTDETGNIETADLVPNRESLVVVSRKGYVKRLREDTFATQNRATRGKSAAKLRDSGELGRPGAGKRGI